jgi:YaaC-like Protein
MDTSQIRFLESAENIKAVVNLRTGRQLSTGRAREVAVCLQQGRQFFEASATAPLEIRPLVEFYGLVGFAKALVLGTKLTALSTLARSHGLSDVTRPGARLTGLTAVIEARGTFVDFNDAVSPINRLSYIDENTHRARILVPTANSADITGLQISLKEVLARLAPLSKLYQYTFAEPPSSESLDHLYFDRHNNYQSTRIVDPQILDSRAALTTIVRRWRERFPYLNRWTIVEANPAWGASYITLANLERDNGDDLTPEVLPEPEPNHFISTLRHNPPAERARIPIDQLFVGIGGGYSGKTSAIAPFSGHYLSEYSLIYIGLFLLSSLVRYRPEMWSHAVSRSSLQDRPVDDQALSLIQAFLDMAQSLIPSLVVKVLNPHEDRDA